MLYPKNADLPAGRQVCIFLYAFFVVTNRHRAHKDGIQKNPDYEC